MRQDYNNYDNYERNERPSSPPPQNRPRWQNGGYFPYNSPQQNSPQRRPMAPPPEVRTPPGLARPAREAPPRPAPPVALEPRREYPEHREYHGNHPNHAYSEHPAAPNYHAPAQPEPRYGRHAPTRDQYVYAEQPKRRGTILRVIGLVLLCALIAGGVGALVTQMILRDWEAIHLEAPEVPTETPEPETRPNSEGVLTATEISELGRQQVVSIRAEVSTVDPFGQTATRIATGTGFILSPDGHILTNYHVVAGAGSITVSMEDGRELEATFLGGEFVTSDVAVLRINATELSPVTFGRSADLRVGESIFAIGNPLELQHSISSGIVSALDREVSLEQGQTISMFQIDASVNRGNSGGPVYNEFGEVVGIVTAKATIDGVEGIGFAIPIEDAMRYAERIIAGNQNQAQSESPSQEQEQGQEHTQTQTAQGTGPWLGVSPVTVTESQAEEFGLVIGVFVNSVYADTAAERGGMRVGDIITAFGGTPIRTVEDLRTVIAQHAVGDTVVLTIWRDGAMQAISLTLSGRPAEQ